MEGGIPRILEKWKIIIKEANNSDSIWLGIANEHILFEFEFDKLLLFN